NPKSLTIPWAHLWVGRKIYTRADAEASGRGRRADGKLYTDTLPYDKVDGHASAEDIHRMVPNRANASCFGRVSVPRFRIDHRALSSAKARGVDLHGSAPQSLFKLLQVPVVLVRRNVLELVVRKGVSISCRVLVSRFRAWGAGRLRGG